MPPESNNSTRGNVPQRPDPRCVWSYTAMFMPITADNVLTAVREQGARNHGDRN